MRSIKLSNILLTTRPSKIWKHATYTTNRSNGLRIPHQKRSKAVIYLPYKYRMTPFQVTCFKHNLNTHFSFTYWLERHSDNLASTPPLHCIRSSLPLQLSQLYTFLILKRNNKHIWLLDNQKIPQVGEIRGI